MAQNSELTKLKAKVDAWRKNKGHRSELMPAALKSAVELAASAYGIGLICKLLKLNTTNISKRIAKQNPMSLKEAVGEPKKSVPQVVRIAPITIAGSQLSPSSSPVPFVVLEAPTGLKLTFFATPDSNMLLTLITSMGGRS